MVEQTRPTVPHRGTGSACRLNIESRYWGLSGLQGSRTAEMGRIGRSPSISRGLFWPALNTVLGGKRVGSFPP